MDRKTVYSFYSLAYNVRQCIMRDIGIPEPVCTLLSETEMFNAMLKKTEQDGKWPELQKAIKQWEEKNG